MDATVSRLPRAAFSLTQQVLLKAPKLSIQLRGLEAWRMSDNEVRNWKEVGGQNPPGRFAPYQHRTRAIRACPGLRVER